MFIFYIEKKGEELYFSLYTSNIKKKFRIYFENVYYLPINYRRTFPTKEN